jgi:hypothetical protein
MLLPSPRRRPPATPGEPADWCGLDRRAVSLLIANYTRPGDVVVDLNAHPMLAQAIGFLGRHPATLLTDRDRCQARSAPTNRSDVRQPGAGLILAKLPRAGASNLDLHSATRAIQSWRPLLRPGGFLLTALTAHTARTAPGPHGGAISCRSTVIAAARAAGLIYHQHILVVRTRLPEYEPRAMPDTAAIPAPALLNGRHVAAHIDLLAFAATAGDADV